MQQPCTSRVTRRACSSEVSETRKEAESDAKPWLVIDSPRVSSLHAKFVHKDGDLILEDHSTNGTWVNGDRIGKGKERALKTGDTIAFIKPGCKEASDATASG